MNATKGVFKKKQAKIPKQPIIQEEVPKIPSDFTSQVAKILIKDGLINNKSVVCSPVSIDAVLRILAAGAKNSTLEELLRSLGHANLEELNAAARELATVLKGSENEDEDYAPVISYVNALWLDQRFLLDNLFQMVLRDVYNAEARAVDFKNQADEVVKEANSWAEEQTKGMIKQVLTRDNIQDDTVLLLANALYFNATWEKKFNQRLTKNADFNLLNGDKIQVPFMNYNKDEYVDYGKFGECQVIKMPYKNRNYYNYRKRFAMYIFLPNESNGLPNLMETIKIDRNLFKVDRVKVKQVSIPKFNLESFVSLKESMKQLGLVLPFEETCKDFSGIIGVSDVVYVNDVVQKCRVVVDEQGTKAAAGTFARKEGSARSRLLPEIKFVADHPFMFMIREDVSGALLFIGSMLRPQ
ncbi:serpin-Z3-like [Silene latifolia]|uniref:serpin-Z3-like n=1 Tax=Silene latifolia TaxID=37657 RepID=UPI003D770E8F